MIFYIALDEGHTKLAGTQADAKAINRTFEQIDIPTDKAGLMAFVQKLYDDIYDLEQQILGLGKNSGADLRPKPVCITLDCEVIGRFDTVEQAEDFLATSATIDPDRLETGDYGIDAPEEMINPPFCPVQASIDLDDQFDKLPLARQLHFAAVAMENARADIGSHSLATQPIAREAEPTTG